MVGAGGWGRGTEFHFYKMESSGGGWWGWLSNNVNVLNATELYT